MSVSGIEAAGFTPYVAPTVNTPQAAPASGGSGAAAAQGPNHDFGSLVLDGIDRLEGVNDRSDQLAVRAATGDLQSIHDYTIAASEAKLTTQLTVAVRNKALESFNEIMRMQV